ncbi:MAG TPA: hypothetical protein VII23_19180 [Terriglobales bacterium]
MSRLWKATFAVLAAGTVLGIAYDRILRPWHQYWGMTRDELGRSWPGDELVPNACSDATHAITINASASQIWPWIVQIGQGSRRLLQLHAARKPRRLRDA